MSAISEHVARAEEFIWLNARLLERHLFAYLYRSGPKEPVLTALRAYQNADGGFGNALEPDKRCPESQPIDVETALYVLDRIDAFDDPMVGRTCDFLETITTPDGGVPFSLPSVNRYPHAPWWEIGENPPASINPTASIVSLLIKHRIEHPWVERATAFCWREIPASDSKAFHDLMPMIAFLEQDPDQQRAEEELERLAKRILEPGVVTLDPDESGYVKKPLDWAPIPESFCRRLFDDETIDLHLRAFVDRQQADGGWPISWDAISPATELEWRGMVTIDALRTLQAYEVGR